VHAPDTLSPSSRRIVEDGDFFVSAASLWELILKKRRRTAFIPDPVPWWARHVRDARLRILAMEWHHIEQVDSLPGPSTDPFDRILIAQCMKERLRLVTKDAAIRDHDQNLIPCVW
jgi:PIN domain nuclease of toxin-antitoxin system